MDFSASGTGLPILWHVRLVGISFMYSLHQICVNWNQTRHFWWKRLFGIPKLFVRFGVPLLRQKNQKKKRWTQMGYCLRCGWGRVQTASERNGPIEIQVLFVHLMLAVLIAVWSGLNYPMYVFGPRRGVTMANTLDHLFFMMADKNARKLSQK